MTSDRPYFSCNSFCCIYSQRNQNLQLFNWCLVPMAIQDIRHLEGCLWEYSIKANMKNFATSPCYHVIIMYVCLGTCTYWLTVHVVIAYDCLDVLHVAVTHFNFIFVEYFGKGVWFFGKYVSISCKKDWPILVVALLLYCGLNHKRLLFLFSRLLVFGWVVN